MNTEKSKIKKLIWYYAIPSIIAALTSAIYNIIDRIFIGQTFGSFAIAGLGISLPIFSAITSLGVLVGIGASVNISIYLGGKKHQEAEKILGTSLLLIIILNIIAIPILYIFLKPIIYYFGATKETFQYAYDYTKIVIISNVFANIMYSFNNMMRASGYPRKAMITILIGVVINVILDAIFIYIFHWGIESIAWGTVISIFIGMCFVISHFIDKKSLIRIKKLYLDKKTIFSIISIGVSPFLLQLGASLITTLLNKFVVDYGGALGTAAYTILNSGIIIIVMIFIGLNLGVQPLLGYNYGAKKYEIVKYIFFYSIKVSILLGFIGFIIGVIFPRQFASIFSTDDKLIDLTINALRIGMLATPLIGFQITASNFFQSIGYPLKSLIQSISRQFLFLIPGIIFLPKFFGLEGIWMSLPISDTISSVLSLYLVIRQIKMINKKQQEILN